MMRSTPQIAVFQDGERFPYLEDEDGLMSSWPTLFTCATSRQARKEYTTIRNELGAIAHLRVWERLERRDLLSEFSRQQFPTEADLTSLANHAQRDARDLKRFAARAAHPHAIELTAPLSQVSLQCVEKSHAYNRITVFAKYLYFCATTLLRGCPNAGALNKQAEKMRDALLALRPKGKRKSFGRLPVHPLPERFDEFMAVVAVDSPDNPFKSEAVRKRNWAAFEAIYETGVRSGELLGLYVGDVKYDDKGDPILKIVDRHDDPNDPRPGNPRVKTLDRDVPISQRLYDVIQDYISNVRYHTPNALKTPFLFVNHRHDASEGSPLTDKNFQNELKRVVAVRPDRFADIRRHGFRHNFNVRLTYQMDIFSAEGVSLTDQQRLDLRKQLNGHTGDKSAETYERGAVQQKAIKAGRKLQDKQASVLRKALAEARGKQDEKD